MTVDIKNLLTDKEKLKKIGEECKKTEANTVEGCYKVMEGLNKDTKDKK